MDRHADHRLDYDEPLDEPPQGPARFSVMPQTMNRRVFLRQSIATLLGSGIAIGIAALRDHERVHLVDERTPAERLLDGLTPQERRVFSLLEQIEDQLTSPNDPKNTAWQDRIMDPDFRAILSTISTTRVSADSGVSRLADAGYADGTAENIAGLQRLLAWITASPKIDYVPELASAIEVEQLLCACNTKDVIKRHSAIAAFLQKRATQRSDTPAEETERELAERTWKLMQKNNRPNVVALGVVQRRIEKRYKERLGEAAVMLEQEHVAVTPDHLAASAKLVHWLLKHEDTTAIVAQDMPPTTAATMVPPITGGK